MRLIETIEKKRLCPNVKESVKNLMILFRLAMKQFSHFGAIARTYARTIGKENDHHHKNVILCEI